jgi:hypothetical protein
MIGSFKLSHLVLAALLIMFTWPKATHASDLSLRPKAGASCNDFVLSCTNGHDYPFCSGAVSHLGDVVTGTLVTGPHRGVHMRLIPMGVGYRYAGRGIWFDGYQSAAALNFGKHTSVACTVIQAPY